MSASIGRKLVFRNGSEIKIVGDDKEKYESCVLINDEIKEITIDMREPEFLNVNCIIFNGKKFMLAE